MKTAHGAEARRAEARFRAVDDVEEDMRAASERTLDEPLDRGLEVGKRQRAPARVADGNRFDAHAIDLQASERSARGNLARDWSKAVEVAAAGGNERAAADLVRPDHNRDDLAAMALEREVQRVQLAVRA
jgi:hypothetical protein